MAWLQRDPSGNYHISFRYGSLKFKRSLRTKTEREALARKSRLEETIRLVDVGRIDVPTTCDIPSFLLSDGKRLQKSLASKTLTLADLVKRFFRMVPTGSLEESTLAGMRRHTSHLIRILGGRFTIDQMSIDDLQRYVDKRSKEPGRRSRNVGAATIKKELRTFSSIWNRAADAGWLSGRFPSRGLRLPRATEKSRFQTLSEIQRRIDRGGTSTEEVADLWECLFLTVHEMERLLEHARRSARHPFIYPMFVFAAYTGARRSEMMRSQLEDIDLQSGIATIREKKRVKGMDSQRIVPLSIAAIEVMSQWLSSHPGGRYTFCHGSFVHGSYKNTGLPRPLSRTEAHHHFEQTLQNSEWSCVRGWHVFRHSFCSNCAAAGVDQRLINAWVGHQTDEMVRRYRHLIPDQQQTAIAKVFG